MTNRDLRSGPFTNHKWILVVAAGLIAVVTLWQRELRQAPPLPPTDGSRPGSTETQTGSTTGSPTEKNYSTIMHDVIVHDTNGRVVFRGVVNLDATLQRIARGERFPHRNDGGTFRNLEGRLPNKAQGYYKEYVHPTPTLEGPGPQRLVIGNKGEVYYTHDHYRTFRKIR